MSTARNLHHEYSDYVRAEYESLIKHEYCNGEIYAMAGGTVEHGALMGSVTLLIGPQLPKSCRVLTSDVKIRIEATDLSTYPDISVVCGPVERDVIDKHAVKNPILVVEITSPSTVDYDRGEKLRHYKQLPSLQAVLLVAHDSKKITVYSRANGWIPTVFSPGEFALVEEPKLSLDVTQIYSVLENL